MEKPKPYFFSEKEIEEYVSLFLPRGTKVLMTKVELTCCEEGHTFRQIMGYDELDH